MIETPTQQTTITPEMIEELTRQLNLGDEQIQILWRMHNTLETVRGIAAIVKPVEQTVVDASPEQTEQLPWWKQLPG